MMEEARVTGEDNELSQSPPFLGNKTKMAPQSTSDCPAVRPGEGKNKKPKNERPNGVHAMKKAFPNSWYPWQSENNHACGVLVEPVSGSMDQ